MFLRLSVLTSCLVLSAVAAPVAAPKHDLVLVKRGDVELPFFYPESLVENNPAPSGSHFAPLSADGLRQLAIATLTKELAVGASELKVIKQFTDIHGTTHVYVDRVVNGIAVANNNAAVHIHNDQVSSYSASFRGSQKSNFVAPAQPVVAVPLEEAVKTAEKMLGAPKDKFEPYMSYLQLPSGQLAYAHNFQLRDDKADKWLHVAVDAKNGQVIEVIDYYNRASYKAIEFPKMVPTDGFTVAVNPANPVASPKGWNSDGKTTYSDTQGNNVNVFVDDGSFHATSSAEGVFDSQWNAAEEPATPANKQASAVHLFYIINKMHDITYQYGFTEAAGNFQANNFGKGGDEGDRVNANDLSTAGTNNANFATPPDGQSGRMNMYLFTLTTPKRDGTLDSVIPVHEFMHGVSNRLTGGSRNGRCLSSSESGGMGEGWSDTVGVYMSMTAASNRTKAVPVGWYVLNQGPAGKGVRKYPYSTDMKVNPHLFSDIKKSSEVHNVGEIWATMLFELYWNLADKLGFSADWYDATQNKGNIVALRLVIGGLMLQPCNPTFIQARDAILKADVNYYNGANKCEIWAAFAKRGLGVSAKGTYVDGFDLPADCKSFKHRK